MATRPEHDKQNQFPRNISRKFFGKASNENGFFENCIQGAFTPYAWPMYWDKEGSATFLCFIASIAATAFGSYELAHHQDSTLDFNPTHEVSADIQNDAVSTTAYNYGGKQYVLRQTDDGTQLFKQLRHDDSVSDDIYVLMDANDAEVIIRSIGSLYHDVLEHVTGEENLWTDYSSSIIAQPHTIAYEGFSGVINDPDSTSFYLIADNYIGEEDAAPLDAPQTYPAWETAMTETIIGDYIQAPRNTENGMALSDMNTGGFMTWLTVMGTLSGLGAIGGASYSAASSRRRFNKELGIS